MARLPPWSAGPAKGERPDRPFTGYKLAHAVLSADGARTGFAGLTLGATRVYGAVADACCVWNRRHAPPRRWCGCGFYCLHDLADARSLGCATENRPALLLEVAASGQYIRYERGLRYSRQRVRAVLDAQCLCGRPGAGLADAGSGLIGWRHLAPVCGGCPAGQAGAHPGGLHRPPRRSRPRREPAVGHLAGRQRPGPGRPGPPAERDLALSRAAESPIAVLTAEIALLHARLDDLQSRLDK